MAGSYLCNQYKGTRTVTWVDEAKAALTQRSERESPENFSKDSILSQRFSLSLTRCVRPRPLPRCDSLSAVGPHHRHQIHIPLTSPTIYSTILRDDVQDLDFVLRGPLTISSPLGQWWTKEFHKEGAFKTDAELDDFLSLKEQSLVEEACTWDLHERNLRAETKQFRRLDECAVKSYIMLMVLELVVSIVWSL
ncbi:uncharacterized protein LOC130796665 [Actinidia eriantha]|uniref:uncharacterized protein LOC130796665 n=1 Tax=Actinidia eriantha TaxID=165200 RepID=UPI00258B952F|nr:uncharacterized protein LOC130796665 [Actinidia eriantha]